MKPGIFQLRKNEQRIVVLIILVLLAGGLIGYWQNAKDQAAATGARQGNATATPFATPEGDVDAVDEEAKAPRNRNQTSPSPQSSP